MVAFLNPTEASKVREYDFREPEGRKPNAFLGDLFKGTGELLNSGVDSLVKATQMTVDEEARTKVDTLKQESIGEYKELVGNTLAAQLPPTTATGGRTDVSGTLATSYGTDFVGPLPAPAKGNEVPSPIQGGLRNLDKLNEGVRQGQFDKERFFGEAQQISANLISRYPGFADYITQKVTHYLGTDPANAQREALQQTIRELLGTGATHRDTYQNDIKAGAKYFGGAWLTEASQTTNPVAQAHYRAQIADRQAVEQSLDRRKKELDVKTAEGNATEVDYQRHATQTLDNDFANMHDTTLMQGASANGIKFTGRRNDVLEALAEQSRTGLPNPEKNQAMALAYGQLEAGFSSHFDREMARAQFNPVVGPVQNFGQFQDSYNTLIKDQNKIAQMKKRYTDQFAVIKDQLGSGLTVLATTNANLVTQQNDSTTAALYRDQYMRSTLTLAKAAGPGFNVIYGDSAIQSGWKHQNELGRFLLEVSTGKTLAQGAAENNNLLNQVKVYEAAAKEKKMADTDPPPEYLRETVNTVKTILTHPDQRVTLQQRVNAAEVISHPLTEDFFKQVKPPHQPFVYADLFAPDVTKYIKGHMTDEVWQRYRGTVERSFVGLTNTYFADINKTVLEDRGITYKWDEGSQRIIATNKLDQNVARGPQRPNDPAVVAADKVNLLLAPLIGVLKEDGKKVSPEYLQAIGLQLDKPIPNQTVKGLFDTFKSIPTEVRPTSTDNGPKAIIPKVPRGALPADTPSPASPGDVRNGKLSLEEIDSHMSRPFKVDGKEVTNNIEKAKILSSIVVIGTKYYYKVGTKLVPVDL